MKILKTSLFLLLLTLGYAAFAQSDCSNNTEINQVGNSPLTLCNGDGTSNVLRFRTHPPALPTAYFVVDENDIIVHIGFSNFIDFEPLPTGNLRVFSVGSASTNILAQVGDNYLETVFAPSCFVISDNFIPIQNLQPIGGMVSTSDDETAITICVNEDVTNIIQFQTTSPDEDYIYLVTDENNVLLDTSATSSIDFSNAPAGICRVWGLSLFAGFVGTPGQSAAEILENNSCSSLSSNFVEVTRLTPEGGRISFTDGRTAVISCTTSAPVDTLRLQVDSNSTNTAFTYVFVNATNNIVTNISTNTEITLATLPAGSYLIYGLSYTGNLTVSVGEAFDEDNLTDECADLSDAPLTLVKRVQDAGSVLLEDGSSEATVCVGDGQADVLTFTSTYQGPDTLIYIITDDNNNVLGISTSNEIDFESAGTGICRVWTAVYSGNLTLENGQNAGSAPISDECFDLSDNFVVINRNGPEGGQIAYTDGSSEVVSCTVLAPTDVISAVVTGNDPNSAYTFILVDTETNTIAGIFPTGTVDLSNLADGSYELYGFSYIGDLTAGVGDGFVTDNLSTECGDFADAPLTLIKRVQNADDVILEDGSSEATVCVGDGEADILTFTSTYQGTDNLIYIITDEGNFVLGISTSNEIDFESAGAGICRVWTAVYSGNLVLENGQNLGDDPVSDECFDLSDGFVVINRNGPEGGQILYTDGSSEFISCTTTAPMGALTAEVTGNDVNSNYTYLLVDTETNMIAGIFPMGTIDLDGLANGTYELYGFSYIGDLTAAIGDALIADNLSSECGDLSDNSLVLVRRVQLVENVTLADGNSSATVCVGDGVPDELEFITSYNGDDTFIYVITDDNNTVLNTSASNTIDFEGAGIGICRVWGLAYSGNLTVEAGETITVDSQLSDECFALSQTFVVINRNGPDGGSLLWDNDETAFLSCSTTEPTGTLGIIVEGNDTDSDYTFIAVDEDNTVVAVQADPNFVLADLPLGLTTVYGLSYQGDLTIAPGDTFIASGLSTSCNDLADNSLTIIKRVQDAGAVSLDDGSDEITICVGDGIPDSLTFTSSTTSADTLVFLITDEQNNLLAISTSNTVDFDSAGEGICRVWAMVYTGDILIAPDDLITLDTELSSECFDLSDNFVTINRNGPEGGSISFADGSTDFQECQATNGNTLELTATDTAPNLDYAYIVVNSADGLVTAIVNGNSIDLAQLPLGTYAVYGISYLGNLTVAVGDVFGNAPLADDCFDLSDNTLNITNRSVNIGGITLVNGNTSAAICPNDGTPDVLNFIADYSGNDNLAYVVTDENNTIIRILSAPGSDFDIPGPSIVRVWAIAYSGNFLLQPGITITPDTQISDDCFDLSDNFVLVDRNGPNGGVVSLTNGSDAATTCSGDGVADILEVNTTGVGGEYVYVVTDENNIILSVSTDNAIDFENAPAGICRIWGLGYGGNLLAMEGDNAAEVELADGCFSLSENFITVTRIEVDGGSVSLADGTLQTFACGGDGEPDFFEFIHTTTATEANYSYIITNDNNDILGILNGNGIDLDEAAAGICRVWGLSYTGEITAQIGENAAEVALTDGCFELSDNFVTITRQEVIGGNVSLDDGTTIINICPNDNSPDVLTFVNDGSTTASYSYAITDTDNNLLSYFQGDSFDFNAVALPTEIRIWGVAYSGLRNPAQGNITTAELSSQCYNVSNNFVTVIREEVVGGTLSTDQGATSLALCTDDGIADVFTFISMGASNTPYAYLITDADNIILNVLVDTDNFDFEGASTGDCRVWGLAYTGELLATPGNDAAATPLSDDCFALTQNFINVRRGSFDAGSISTIFLTTEYSSCPDDGEAEILQLLREGNLGNNATFVYLLADENGILLEAFTEDGISFETRPEGIYRIYSFAHSGEFPLDNGTDLTALDLSASCSDLSDNFVTVNNFPPAAGTITANGGMDMVTICAGDGTPDVVNLEVTGANDASYIYIVVDEDDNIVGLLTDTVFDFENASAGIWRIFGMSYSGSLQAFPGGNLSDELASSCFELTSNSVLLDKTFIDGAEIFTDDARQVIYACPDDLSIVNFVNSSMSDENYRYLLTNEDNLLLSVLTGNAFDLNDAGGFSRLRMWGASFAGELALNIGSIVTESAVADNCGVISDNFIDIFIDSPEGGMLSLEDGSTEGRLCHGNTRPGLFVQTTSTATVGYAYLLTDEANNVLAISEDPDGFVNFDSVEPGIYRIWAVSYTGGLAVQIGDDAAVTQLATSCFELSENFVTVERTESIIADDVATAAGETELYFCPGDGQPDIVQFLSGRRFIITDTLGNIITTDIESPIINFDVAPPGVCRIYGVDFTGTFDPPSGGNIFTDPLSTDCHMLSPNFILIVKQEPEGGTVSTTEGETEIEVTVGDGVPDVFNFTNTGIELTPYTYIITDEFDIIIGISDDGEIDFEGAGPGICHVWGLSYTGDIRVGIDDDLIGNELSDDCFDLSDNFVTVTRVEAEGDNVGNDESQQPQSQLGQDESSVQLRPNPVVDVLQLEITVHGNAISAAQRIDIFDVNGLLVRSVEINPSTETQTTSFDVSQLQAGIYLLRWENGEEVIIKRFIKQD